MPRLADPERDLALAYAPSARRDALAAIWSLDEQLGAIVARTENPAAGQIRLTWWHDALKTLGADRPVDPVLIALKNAPDVDPIGLLPMIDGWERLLEPLPIEVGPLAAYAQERGGTMFRASAALLGSDPADAAGPGGLWALVDLAFRVSDRTTAERALSVARSLKLRPPRLAKPLAILTALAERDLRRGLARPRRQGSPARVGLALWAGLTGS